MGDGTHKLPSEADIRRAIGKEMGDAVTVLLEERIKVHTSSPFHVLAYNTPGRSQGGRTMQRVGVIRMLARYPVKSMRGEAYTSLPLTLQGFEEDRRFAFVQAESRSSFPWLTAREMPELLRWQTSVEKPGTPDVAVTGLPLPANGGRSRAASCGRPSRNASGNRSFCSETIAARSMSLTSPSSASKLSNALPRNPKPRRSRGAFGPTC